MYLMRELVEHMNSEDSVYIHRVLQLCPVRILATLAWCQCYAVNCYKDFIV